MAYLVPDSINPDLIFSEFIEDEENRDDAIDLLLKYSMINIKDRILSIHRLVQEVIRHQLKVNGKEKDVLKNALKLLGFNPRYGDIHLISVWSYACDYGEIIDEFFIKYKRYGCLMTPFNLIVENGNIDAVKKILNHFQKNSNEKFQDILNSTKYHHMTPLEISIRHNNLEMAKVLIGFGAEKDIKICVKSIFDGSVELVNYFYPNNVEYLLHAKFYSAFESESVKSLNNLLKDLTNEQIKNILEQKITNVDPKLIIESPPLILAVQRGNLDIVKLFINYGVDVNVSCADGTPLHASVRNNHYEIMKCLIENGANCNTVNSCENTVLHTAAKRGHLELITYLINNNKCDRNDINKWGWTALDVATEYNRLEVVEFLRK